MLKTFIDNEFAFFSDNETAENIYYIALMIP